MVRRARGRNRAVATTFRPVAALLAAALLPAPPPAIPAATPGPHAGLRRPYIDQFTGRPAPLFTLRDLKGGTVRLASYRGRVVILNFWYSTCIPCRKETPDLISLHQAYKDQGLAILGINLDAVMIPQAGGRELEKFLKAFPIPYPILIADQAVVDQYGGLPVQPISFLVDRGGLVERVFWGAFDGSVYERAVVPLLARPSERPAAPGSVSAPPRPRPAP